MKGITMVAPPTAIGHQEMKDLKEVNTEWIALVPYGFSRIDQPNIRYNLDRQWWGEREEGIVESIRLAHENGIKVMLKPQVYIHNSWVGDVDFDNEEDWVEWEDAYREYIHFYGKLAAEHRVELYCIGTEYKKAVKKRTKFWRTLIKEIREYYSGELIYSSNWDGYEDIPIWNDLDYIGISAYFPLTDQKTPTVNSLAVKWRPIKTKLEKFAKKTGKAIVFTEYGYLSIDKCAWRAWELEKNIRSKSINEKAQANAYDSLLKTFWNEEWWGGGFLWKWFPAGMGHEGYPERDYTPQGKLSEQTIRDWYGKD
ncbi:MAG: hypothetical protein AAGA77_16145 [Bacteroidota bacterium]